MPRYYEETIEHDNVPCAGLRADLLNCLRATDCVKKEKMTPKQCLLQEHPSVPEKCFALRTTFFECKRSLLDTRQRFRGRKGY